MGLDLTRLARREDRVALDLGKPNAIQRQVLKFFREGKRFVLMVAGRQSGKALALDTEVPTPTGWTTMGALKEGDEVFAPDGSVTKVTWVSEVDWGPVTYKITLDDGTEIVADADHEWVSYTKRVRKSMGRSRHPMEPELLTTQEMYETQIVGGHDDWTNPRNGRRRESNHALKVPEAVRYARKDLPLDPYVFGVWLGDGSSDAGVVWAADDEMWDFIQERGYELGKTYRKSSPNKAVGHTVLGMAATLEEMGVLYNKHIPDVYMQSSVEQRRDLLKGLLDTDGSVNRAGGIEFYSSNYGLAVQVRELISSLGYKTRIRSKEAKAYGKSYGLTYTVTFNAEESVFMLPRKNKLIRRKGRMERHMRYVHSIELVEPAEVVCIGVEHESEEFLITRNFVPTHNSHIGARWLILQTMNPNAKEKLAFAVAPTYKMARVIVRKLNEVLQSHPDLWKKIEYKAGPPATYTFPNGWVIEVHSSDNPDSLRGPTVSAVWFDEIAAADEEAFDILTPTLLASGGSLFGTTTPRGVENWVYYRLHEKSIPPGAPGHKPDSYHPMYASATGSTWDNVENLTEEAVQMLENQYGEGSVFGRQELYGEFVSFEGLVYRWDAHNTLPVDEMPKLSEYSHIVGGIDFGWTDPASATVLGYKDGQWYAIDEVYGSEIEINDLATRIGDLHSRYRVSRWYADSARPDLIADLNSRGIPVLPVKKPKIEDRIREMAAFTDNHGFKVSTNCPNVIRELTLYRWPEKKRRDGSGAAVPVDENNHSMDGIGYAIWSMRWLWRNDVAAKERLEKRRKDVDIEEEQFQRWKRKHGFGKRKRYGYAGLLGR